MSALDEWQSRSIFEVTLDSGTRVKARYVDMEQALMSGEFDVGILEELDKSIEAVKEGKAAGAAPNGNGPSQEQLAEGLKYKQWIICTNVIAVSGEAVTLSPDDYFTLPEKDRDELYAYIRRAVPVPLVAS